MPKTRMHNELSGYNKLRHEGAASNALFEYIFNKKRLTDLI